MSADLPHITREELDKYGVSEVDERTIKWLESKGLELNKGDVKISLDGREVLMCTDEKDFGTLSGDMAGNGEELKHLREILRLAGDGRPSALEEAKLRMQVRREGGAGGLMGNAAFLEEQVRRKTGRSGVYVKFKPYNPESDGEPRKK